MKVALIGYGKMGKAIEKALHSRLNIEGQPIHEVVLRIDKGDREALYNENIKGVDIAIEFTSPDAAFDNVMACLYAGIPVVSGTTAWLSQLPEARKRAEELGVGFFWSSNYSIGVNLFFRLNHFLATLMSNFNAYRPSIKEIHHTQKLDAPSGTAITLAQQVLDQYPDLLGWALGDTDTRQLSITALREPEVPGTHTITYRSNDDTIEISHLAHSREGFATGAVVAAEWLLGKKGAFGMNDLMKTFNIPT